jgi:Spy/CpxP family protein refolding chaperone
MSRLPTGRSRPAPTLVAAALLALAAPAASPQTVKETLEISRQAAESQRRLLISGSLPLTDAQAKSFWPLYDDYEKERRSIDERSNRLVADFVASYNNLSDSQAKDMLAQAIKVDEEHLALRRSYTARMGKVLPPRLLVRFFQIENKLDAVIRADIARQIPLVQ